MGWRYRMQEALFGQTRQDNGSRESFDGSGSLKYQCTTCTDIHYMHMHIHIFPKAKKYARHLLHESIVSLHTNYLHRIGLSVTRAHFAPFSSPRTNHSITMSVMCDCMTASHQPIYQMAGNQEMGSLLHCTRIPMHLKPRVQIRQFGTRYSIKSYNFGTYIIQIPLSCTS